MHPLRIARRRLLGGLAASIVGLSGTTATMAQQPAAAQPVAPLAKEPEVRVGKSGELLVPLGGVVRFTPKPAGFKDVLNQNQEVLTVAQDAADANALLLTGRIPGLTRLVVTYADGRSTQYEVIVQPDYDLLRRVIQRAVPTASVEVIPGVGTGVILTGYVNKVEDVDIILRIAEAATAGAGGQQPGGAQQQNVINAIQVGGVQHVQIEVVVAQVDRTELRERGFDFSVNQPSAQFGSFVSALIAPQSGALGGGLAGLGGLGSVNPGGAANLQLGLTSPGIFMALRALRAEGLAKFLSEPKVVTQSGRPAIIRSGGQQAVLGNTAGGLGSISVDRVPVGTTLEVLPIVYGNGKIYLEVAPSIVTTNQALGIQTSAGFSPGFNEQSTVASVMLESGQTFAIGGLLETQVSGSTSRVPVLGDIPYVGAAFSRISYETRERELVVLVTPRLAEPMDCTQVPNQVPGLETRNPDDYELYLEGLLEAPRGQRQVWNGRCYNAAWKCDPNGLFPCKGNICTGANGSCATPGLYPTTVKPASYSPLPAAQPATTNTSSGAVIPVLPAEATTPYVPQTSTTGQPEVNVTLPEIVPIGEGQ